jgi:hypothetical protein
VYAIEFSTATLSNSFSASVAAAPTASSGGTVTVPVSCFTVPCSVDATLGTTGTTRTTGTTADAATAEATGYAAATRALGTGMIQITQPGVQHLKIPLSTAGRAALAASRGSLHAVLNETTDTAGYEQAHAVRVTVHGSRETTTHKKKHKKKKHKKKRHHRPARHKRR